MPAHPTDRLTRGVASAPRYTKTRAILVDGKHTKELKGDALLYELVRQVSRLATTQEVLVEEIRTLNRRVAELASELGNPPTRPDRPESSLPD